MEHLFQQKLFAESISPPMGLDRVGSFRPQYKPPQVAQSTGYAEQFMAQPSPYPFQSQMAHQWNTSLEWRLQRIEKENALLFSENQRLQTSYSEALDLLGSFFFRISFTEAL